MQSNIHPGPSGIRQILSGLALGIATWAAAAAFATAADPAPPDKPFLWRVEGNGIEKPSHLFGTIHLSNDRIRQLHPAAEQAFDAAGAFHAEVTMEPAAQMAAAALMMRRDNRTLSDSIGPELTEALADRLAEIQPGLDIAILQPMKTWAAAMIVVMLPYQLEGREALDQILWNRAQAAGKTVHGLEEIADQIGAFDVLDEDQQVLFLRETLATLEDGDDMMRQLIAAYEAGDEQTLGDLLTESMTFGENEDPAVIEAGEKLIKALIADRDTAMAAKIHEILREDPARSHFFAVGAAHYLGDESIRKHLEDKGYTITRVPE